MSESISEEHVFSTPEELQELYDNTVLLVEQYGAKRGANTALHKIIVFREEAICRLAPEAARVLNIRRGLEMYAWPDTPGTVAYYWLTHETNYKDQYIHLKSPEFEGDRWKQNRRTKLRSELQSSTQDSEEDRIKLLADSITQQEFEHSIGSHQVLRYEATALRGLIAAILELPANAVADTTCTPEYIEEDSECE